jgi:holo-[acyl-carrier protein] synthase
MPTLKHKKSAVGIDAVEVLRFKYVIQKNQVSFLEKVFSPSEIEYCSSFKDKAIHFAGLFAAKEATSKALGVVKYPFAEIEVRHTKEGAPVAFYKGKKLRITLAITHTKSVAIAVAIS